MSEEYCPICESEMIIFNSHTMHCKNKCYVLFRNGYRREEVIFGQYFVTTLDDFNHTAKLIDEEIKKTIAYWRENERYLTKLMEN